MSVRKGTKLPRYPWDKWFAKNKFILRKGNHFTCRTYSMATQIRNAATVRGLYVSIRIDDASERITVEVL